MATPTPDPGYSYTPGASTGSGQGIFSTTPGPATNNQGAQVFIYTGRISGYTPVGGVSSIYRGVGGAYAQHYSQVTKQGPAQPPSGFWGQIFSGPPSFLTAGQGAGGEPQTTTYSSYVPVGGGRQEGEPTPPSQVPNYEKKTLDDFIWSFANLDKKDLEALQTKLLKAGILTSAQLSGEYGRYGPSTRAAVGEVAFEVAVQQAQTGKPSITFDSALDQAVVNQQLLIAQGKVANPEPFTGSRSRTDVSTQITDPTTAQAVVTNALSQLLGRAPTAGEIAQFQATLRAKEAASPVTTHTTTSYKAGIETGSTSTQTGGLTSEGAALLAQQQAMGSKDYGAYQAATTYFNALLNAVGAVNSAGA